MALHELVCGCVGVHVCVSKVNCTVVSILSLWMITQAATITFQMHSDVTPKPFAEPSSKLCHPSPGYGTYVRMYVPHVDNV